MSPFGPAFVILPTRTLPTSPDESRQLDELAEKIVICVPIYALLSILMSVASGLPSSSRIMPSLAADKYWKRWKYVGFANRP